MQVVLLELVVVLLPQLQAVLQVQVQVLLLLPAYGPMYYVEHTLSLEPGNSQENIRMHFLKNSRRYYRILVSSCGYEVSINSRLCGARIVLVPR